MLQEKDQSTSPPEKLQDSQCLNYHEIHEPPYSAMLPHHSAMGGRQEQSCISYATTSAPWEPQPCPWTFCFTLSLSVCLSPGIMASLGC